MNEPAPKKPLSIRADEATAEKFKALAAEYENPNAALSALIQAFEMQSAQRALPGQSDVIANFEGYLQRAADLFIAALDSQNTAEERARAAAAAQLESKDGVIIALQEEIKDIKSRAQASEDRAVHAESQLDEQRMNSEKLIRSAEERAAAADKRAEQAERAADTLKELNAALTANLDNQETLKARVGELEEAAQHHSESLAEVREQLRAARAAADDKDRELELMKERHALELERAKAEAARQSADEVKALYKKLEEVREHADEHITALRSELAAAKAAAPAAE